jgi:GTP cyclohydrolase-4
MNKQIQNEYSSVPINVGIEEVKTLIKVGNNTFLANISLKISSMNNRAIHMSRIVESISESINNVTAILPTSSIEEYCLLVYEDLSKRHLFDDFNMKLSTQLAINSKTPSSNLNTTEIHDVAMQLIYLNGNLKKILSVDIIGSSACPHGLTENEQGRTHIQRSLIQLSWESENIARVIEFEDLIDICNKSFSSPVYSLLKTPDEQNVINTMFDNPCFVEDIIRNVITNSSHLKNGILDIKVTNYESIHRHNAIAQKTVKLC